MSDTCATCRTLAGILAELLDTTPPAFANLPVMTENVRAFINVSGLVVHDPDARTLTADLYNTYRHWAPKPLGQQRFYRELTRLGFPAYKGSGGVRLRQGLRLNT